MAEKQKYFLTEPQAVDLLERYAIPYPPHAMAQSALEAAAAAKALGFPVVLKIVSPDVPHKSDAGGVAAGLDNELAVCKAYDEMISRVQTAAPDANLEGVLVCRQAEPGLEVIVGALVDETFGPAVMFGLGGIFTEILKDVSFRIAPLQARDARQMVQEIRGYPLLTGARGHEAVDLKALIDLLISVSNLVIEHPQIHELDLNPVRLYPWGLAALDARMLVC